MRAYSTTFVESDFMVAIDTLTPYTLQALKSKSFSNILMSASSATIHYFNHLI